MTSQQGPMNAKHRENSMVFFRLEFYFKLIPVPERKYNKG